MPRYFIGMYQPEGVIPSPDFLAPVMRDMGVLMDELTTAGSLVFSDGFDQTVPAVLVTSDGTSIEAHPGSFHAGTIQLGGVTVVDVADARAAHDIAARMATLTGLPIEVRLFRRS